MTKERLQELAIEAKLPLSKFLLATRNKLGLPMRPLNQLRISICDKASIIGDKATEDLIKAPIQK